MSTPSQEPIVVANIGRLVSQKGPERFVVAADRFAEEARFVWIGGRTSDSDEPPMGANVEVTGNLPHHVALDMLSRASIHLFTSKWEGMPLALMESQAMGIPSIAWSCPGTSDVIVEGQTGFLVNNEAEMVARLSDLLTNKTLRDSVADRARNLRSRFSDEGYGERSINAYRQLALERHSRGNRAKKRDRVTGH
ncbi:glycosyltransferase [Arthrobacter humicola]